MTRTERRDLLPGTLEMLILKSLTVRPMHGYGVARHIEGLSRGVFQVGEGSLYPALQRMSGKGWIASEWAATRNGRDARFYSITEDGRQRLRDEEASFAAIVDAIGWVMNPESTGSAPVGLPVLP